MPHYVDYDEEDSENGYKKGAWTPEEDAALYNLIMVPAPVLLFRSLKANSVPTLAHQSPRNFLRKRATENSKAVAVQKHGARNWSEIALGVRGRSGKSCRLRWCNQLNPDVKKDPFSEWEDAVIINAHKVCNQADSVV